MSTDTGHTETGAMTCPRCVGFGFNNSPAYFYGTATCMLCAGTGLVVQVAPDRYKPALSSDDRESLGNKP